MTNVTSIVSLADPWDIGTLQKNGIWGFYVTSNFLGIILCVVLIMYILCNSQKSASETFIVGLAFSCILLSAPCGFQCLCNIIAGRFYGGEIACQIEAIVHISSIQAEFACVAALFLNMYLTIIQKRHLKQRTSAIIVTVIIILCIVITALLSLISKIYLMSAGTFCFFAFTSVAVAGWLVPGLIISLAIMVIVHVKIMSHFARLIPGSSPNKIMVKGKIAQFITLQDVFIQKMKWRSTLFILALAFGWGFALVATIYEFAVGDTSEIIVTGLGVGGVLFSVAVPLIFFATLPTKCMARKLQDVAETQELRVYNDNANS